MFDGAVAVICAVVKMRIEMEMQMAKMRMKIGSKGRKLAFGYWIRIFTIVF